MNFNVKPFHPEPANPAGAKKNAILPAGVIGISSYEQLRETLANYDGSSGTLNLALTADCIGSVGENRVQAKTYSYNIDLMGHRLGRASTTKLQNDGRVIEVIEGGSLTITDSDGNGTGAIVGGYAYNGGWQAMTSPILSAMATRKSLPSARTTLAEPAAAFPPMAAF